jgi:hypothetical protein
LVVAKLFKQYGDLLQSFDYGGDIVELSQQNGDIAELFLNSFNKTEIFVNHLTTLVITGLLNIRGEMLNNLNLAHFTSNRHYLSSRIPLHARQLI